MSASVGASSRGASRPVLIGLLLLAAWAMGWFVANNFPRYLNLDPASWGAYYWPRRMALLPHILGGFVAGATGLVQLWLGLNGRTGPLHRVLGRCYGGAILVGATGSFYMALTIPPAEFGYAAGLFMLGVAWVVTTTFAVIAARRRQFLQHRDWMLRSYTVTFAFAAFRIGEKWLAPLHLMTDAQLEQLLAWGCWSVPLLLMEPVIQWRALMRPRP